MQGQNLHLPIDIRTRAERISGVDLSDVVVQISDKAFSNFGLAATCKTHICISSSLQNLPHNFQVEVLGHEIAHVIQYKKGLMGEAASMGRQEILSHELRMEGEAWIAGKRFSEGSEYAFESLSRKFSNSLPYQQYLLIDGKLISTLSELSEKSQTILQMIESGSKWFEWTAKQEDQGYTFSSESEFLEGVQSGLHGSSLMLISKPDLLVNPVRLLGLSIEELTLLKAKQESEKSNKVESLQVHKILSGNGLRIKSELAIGFDFLKQIGVSDATILQAMSLGDLVDLFDMVDESSSSSSLNSSIQKEGAKFALAIAQNPGEFIDLYKFYITVGDKLGTTATKPAKRKVLAEQYVQDIVECLFDAGLSPIVEPGISPIELRAAIQNWIDGGRYVGFRSVSRGALQVMKNSRLCEPGQTLNTRNVVEEYLTRSQNFLKSYEASPMKLTQDGLVGVYQLNEKEASATLEVTQQGYLTLARYDVTKVT